MTFKLLVVVVVVAVVVLLLEDGERTTPIMFDGNFDRVVVFVAVIAVVVIPTSLSLLDLESSP